MKKLTICLSLAVLLLFTVVELAGAQTGAPQQGAINFTMIGITKGQTLQLNLVAYPPQPCIAQLGFQDSNGNVVGPTSSVSLNPGQSASVSVNGNALVKGAGQRAEVLPVVTSESTYPSTGCIASAEVIDNLLGITSVGIPGSVGYPPQPIYGILGATPLQTVRLNVVAYPPVPCVGELSFADANGNATGKILEVNLAPGHATFLDFTPSGGLTTRTELRPVVTEAAGGAPGACRASVEVYVNGAGVTQAYYPPNPIFSAYSGAEY